MHKIINGEKVVCSEEESKKIQDEWDVRSQEKKNEKAAYETQCRKIIEEMRLLGLSDNTIGFLKSELVRFL